MKRKIAGIISLLLISTIGSAFGITGNVIGIIETKTQQGIREDVVIYDSPYVEDDQQLKDNINLLMESEKEVLRVREYQGTYDFSTYIQEILQGGTPEAKNEVEYIKDSSFDLWPGEEENHQRPGAGDYVEHIEVSIVINGRLIDAKGYSENGRTMVPIRPMAEALGGKVQANFNNPNLKLVTVTYYDQRLDFRIGGQTAYLNYRQFMMDAAPDIKEGTTYVPYRYFLDIFKGYEVKLDNSNYRILITSKGV